MKKTAFISLLLLPILFCTNAFAKTDSAQLRVLETTDIHMWLTEHDYFSSKASYRIGLTRTATLIKQARKEVKNSVLVDNGDLLQGSPMGDYVFREQSAAINAGQRVHPAYQLMNTLSYDVGNIGNHEFNYGLEFLLSATNKANFPYISANVVYAKAHPKAGQPLFNPYLIKTHWITTQSGKKRAINIGYIGFVPPQIMMWDRKNLEGKVEALDTLATAKKYLPQMKLAGADIVIAIPHSGIDKKAYERGDENAVVALAQVKGIDAILFGHTHQVFPGDSEFDNTPYLNNSTHAASVHGVAAVMPGYWGSHLGVIDFDLAYDDKSGWEITGFKTDVRSLTKETKTDQAAEATLATWQQQTVSWLNTKLLNLPTPMTSFFAQVRDESVLQVISDAQLAYAKQLLANTPAESLPILSAVAPFRSGRRSPDDFTQISAGEMTRKHVMDMYIYPNTAVILKLTGKDIREWLERSAGQFHQVDINSSKPQYLINPKFASFNFDVLDGVTYEIDVTQPSRYDVEGHLVAPNSHRIKTLRYQGKPVQDAQTFLVITNNYRASGGGNFPGINSEKIYLEAADENRQILTQYLSDNAQSLSLAADNNWKLSPIKTRHSLTLLINSSPSPVARNQAKESGLLEAKTVNSEGYQQYQVRLTR